MLTEPIADLTKDAGLICTAAIRNDVPAQIIRQIGDGFVLPTAGIKPDLMISEGAAVGCAQLPAPPRRVDEVRDFQIQFTHRHPHARGSTLTRDKIRLAYAALAKRHKAVMRS